MKIKNTGKLSPYDLQHEVSKGARFIYFPYTLSFVFFTLKRTSAVYLVRTGEKTTFRRSWFALVSFLFGWWGIPIGPKHTIKAIRITLRGGKNVTNEVMAVVNGYALFEESQHRRGRTKLSKITL
jgi:hypothetical protein